MSRVYKTFHGSSHKPNNVEAWVEADIVFCLCDEPLISPEQHVIEDMLGLDMGLGFRTEYREERNQDGKYLISWRFLESPDVDWS